MITIGAAAQGLELSVPTVTSAIRALAEINIIQELTGNRRNRIYSYRDYLTILNEGTEPLRPPGGSNH